MKHTICNQVRFEIDEKELAAPLSTGAMEHLRQCVDCQEFQTKETSLRKIVGSLETVNAPADFDFRLRARLANDGSAAYRLSSPVRVWRLRSIAVAAMLLIFAGSVFMLRQTNPPQSTAIKTDQASKSENVVPPKTNDGASNSNNSSAEDNSGIEQATAPIAAKQNNPPPRKSGPSPNLNKRPSVAVDFASKPAPVVATMPTFPLDVSQQVFKVSLDDGTGSSRTISVPAVSFGSRRVLMSGSVSSNQFAPKGDW